MTNNIVDDLIFDRAHRLDEVRLAVGASVAFDGADSVRSRLDKEFSDVIIASHR